MPRRALQCPPHRASTKSRLTASRSRRHSPLRSPRLCGPEAALTSPAHESKPRLKLQRETYNLFTIFRLRGNDFPTRYGEALRTPPLWGVTRRLRGARSEERV